MSACCKHTQDLAEQPLTKEQEDLVGKGCAGPPVALDNAPISDEQVLMTTINRGRGDSQMLLPWRFLTIIQLSDDLDCDLCFLSVKAVYCG